MTPEQRYAELVEVFLDRLRVTHAGGTRGFGSSALEVDGKIFAMLSGDRLVVKLPRGRVEKLIAPGHGRLMREWLSAPPSADWPALAGEALACVQPE